MNRATRPVRTSGKGAYSHLGAAEETQDTRFLRDIADRLEMIEAKLDALLQALVAEGEEDDPPQFTLDGEPAGEPRDKNESLD